MKVLNKRIPFIYAILILLIIGFVLNSVIYWYGPYYTSFLKFFPEQRRLQELDKMTDQELVNKVSNLRNLPEISLAVWEKRVNYIIKNMTNYLICRADYTGSEESYNLAKGFIENSVDNKESAEEAVRRLDEVYSSEKSFFDLYALASLETICSNGQESEEILKLCLEEGNLSPDNIKKLSPEKIRKDQENCHRFCEDLELYAKDPSIFKNEISVFDWYDDSQLLYYQYKVPMAIAFRIGGREFVLEICDFIPNSRMKRQCIRELEEIDNLVSGCKEFRQRITNLFL